MKYITTLTTQTGFFFFFLNKYSSCTNFSRTKQGRLPEWEMIIPLEVHSLPGSPVLYLACPVDTPCEETLPPPRAEAEQGSDGEHKAQVNQEEGQEVHPEPCNGTRAAVGPLGALSRVRHSLSSGMEHPQPGQGPLQQHPALRAVFYLPL